MKKIITIIAVAMAAFAFSFDASAQNKRGDVFISYDMLTSDASFRQFKKAKKSNQIEILNYLVDQAKEKYLECETIEQLYDVKERLDLIKFYNSNATQKSISITNAIRTLENKIIQTEAEYKNEVVIRSERDDYQDKGQDDVD